MHEHISAVSGDKTSIVILSPVHKLEPLSEKIESKKKLSEAFFWFYITAILDSCGPEGLFLVYCWSAGRSDTLYSTVNAMIYFRVSMKCGCQKESVLGSIHFLMKAILIATSFPWIPLSNPKGRGWRLSRVGGNADLLSTEAIARTCSHQIAASHFIPPCCLTS